ncbi:unnamed protein product [Boreogadus saida]
MPRFLTQKRAPGRLCWIDSAVTRPKLPRTGSQNGLPKSTVGLLHLQSRRRRRSHCPLCFGPFSPTKGRGPHSTCLLLLLLLLLLLHVTNTTNMTKPGCEMCRKAASCRGENTSELPTTSETDTC